MGFIVDYALDGSVVAIEVEMISMFREVSTKTLLGEEKWKEQSETWRRDNPVTTVVSTRQNPAMPEVYLAASFMQVAMAINKCKGHSFTDALVHVQSLQDYDEKEFKELVENDLDAIKEKGLICFGCVGA